MWRGCWHQHQPWRRVPSLDDNGRGIRSSDSDQIARLALGSLDEAGAGTLIVEDDLARRGDPGPGPDVAFIADRVIRWSEFRVAAGRASRLLRTGDSGYPLNAFVCWQAPGELGLMPGVTLSETQQEAIVDSARAVISSVYDAEAYLMLLAGDLDARLR